MGIIDISKKITLTEEEFRKLIEAVYDDVFYYGKNFDKHWKDNNDSKCMDLYSYSRNLTKKLFK